MESGEWRVERRAGRERVGENRRVVAENVGGEQTRRADEESRERETAGGNRRVVEIGGEWKKEEWRVEEESIVII